MCQKKWLVVMGFVLCLAPISAYADSFTNIQGWNYAPVFFSGVSGQEGDVSGVDIDGEVGHPLYVNGPQALCEPSRKWTLSVKIEKGELPPGMAFDEHFGITGIPTERGHWIVTIRAYDFVCEGTTYMGFTQQVRFHITGSGKVIE